MKPGPGTLILSLLLFASLLGGSALLQRDRIATWLKTPSIYRDSLYIPDSRYVRAVAMGYDMSVSDFLWLRMIQAYAGGWSKKENAEMMEQYFDVVTDLDPHFFDVYSFTIMAVGEDGKRPDLAMRVVRKGMVENPGDYRVPLEGASYASLNMSDTRLAKFYTHMALLDPKHPDYIERWLPHFEVSQGRFQLAYEKYFSDMLEKLNSGNLHTYDILRRHLKRAIDEWIRSEIKTRAEDWRKRNNTEQWPTVEMLEQEGLFKGIRVPDWRIIENIVMTMSEGPASQSELDPAAVDQVVQSAIRTWDGVPYGPNDANNPEYTGYVIWPQGELTEEQTEDNLVISRYVAAQLTQKILILINRSLDNHQIEHNEACPESLIAMDPNIAKISPPLGGQYELNRETCRAFVPGYPNLLDQFLPD